MSQPNASERNLKSFFAQSYHWFVFAAFLVCQGFSLFFVVLSGDDYYYANFIPSGWSYFLSETIVHYEKTNGRAMVHLLDELVLTLPLWIWKILALCLIGGVVYLCASFVAGSPKDQKRFPKALSISCVLFSMIHLYILRESVLWATGSFNYLFPAFLTLLFYVIFWRKLSQEKGAWYLPILAFFAAFTTEQSSAATVGACILLILFQLIVQRKHLRLTHYLSLITSVIAAVTVIFAPGNAARQTYSPEFYEMSLFERIYNNLKLYFDLALFKQGMLFFFVVLFLGAAFFSIANTKNNNASKFSSKTNRIETIRRLSYAAAVLYLTAAISLVLHSAFFSEQFFVFAINLFIFVLAIICLLIQTFVMVFTQNDPHDFILTLLAAMCFIAMLLSPIIGYRLLLVPILLLFIPIIRFTLRAFALPFARYFIPLCIILFALDLISVLHGAKFYLGIIVCTVCFLASYLSSTKLPVMPFLAILGAFCVTISVGCGYSRNQAANQYNLSVTEAYIEAQDFSKPLVLAYQPAEEYVHCPLYRDPYHQTRYKQYYQIPTDVPLVFKTVEELGIE